MFKWFAYLLVALFLIACGEVDYAPPISSVEEKPLFENFEKYEVDSDNFKIKLKSDVDSLEIHSLSVLGSGHYYLALDGDLEDPEIDWDNPLESGAVLIKENGEFKNIVILDGNNRVIAVWQIKLPEGKSSSSADESSKEPADESSSSEEPAESSDSEQTSSSSSESAGSSSSETTGSSSIEEIVESSSNSAEAVAESSCSSTEPVASSSSEDLVESSSSSTYEPQLPGTDFSKRDDSFWATTSDAMATEGSGKYKPFLVNYTVTVKGSANAVFEDSKLTLTTSSVTGTALGIDGGWKMAGGFYFAGSYSGTDAASIYVADNSDAGADGRPADFSQYMKHGRPFDGRPTGFSVTYAYEHCDNTNDTYPQKSLIYVMLISDKKKVVAAGAITDESSVEELTTKKVDLVYGSDAGLIAAGYAGTEDLSKGTGEEDVAEIRVMFASSALAFVADGGTSSKMKANFRGGENSKLILDEFQLLY